MMKARANLTPKKTNQSDIQPRRMDFDFAITGGIPKYWFANDQFKSTLLTALSCAFPEGERFFVRSVRHFQPFLRNKKLKEEVKGFIGQEAHHGNEHEDFNQALEEQHGLPTSKIERYVREGMKWQGKVLSPQRQLAKTCALEHFTAMLAETILEHPEMLAGMDERLLPLWVWHAVEESEHKSVAFDVFEEQVGSYWIRSSEMLLTTLEFFTFTALHYIQLRRPMASKTDWRSVRGGFAWLLGRKEGWLRRLGPRYLSYYKPSFHPSQVDSRHLHEQGLKRLAALLDSPEMLQEPQ